MNKISCVTTQHERMSLSCRTCYVISKYMLYTCHCATKTIPRYSIFIDLSEYGLGTIEIGEATVTHEGIRRLIPWYVWVGPGVTARVTSLAKKPWDSYKVICSLCKGEGHKAWDCPKQTSCSHCKATTHRTVDCQYCNTCKKYGHAGECTASQRAITKPERKTQTTHKKSTGRKNRLTSKKAIK